MVINIPDLCSGSMNFGTSHRCLQIDTVRDQVDRWHLKSFEDFLSCWDHFLWYIPCVNPCEICKESVMGNFICSNYLKCSGSTNLHLFISFILGSIFG